ncbi:alpha/beta fold hydrolase [Nocardioides humi]|uniref:Alpha/beta hydrolase n=1 Tax=Nocardioides humi TaxID=449461 RepID=A0ABN2BQG4_9ACTN|nr:alpha/beta hydrolase [Nocardioides humi]
MTPTIVLVHGAWSDTSAWAPVLRRLHSLGYPVLAHPCPLRSLAGDAVHLQQRLETIDGPLVLVGHSYGAGVVANAVTDDPDVQALVFVNGLVPTEGETITELVGHDSIYSADAADRALDIVPRHHRRRWDSDCYLPERTFVDTFASGLRRAHRQVLWAAQRPISLGALDEVSAMPASDRLPSWFLIGTEDRVLPPETQEAMAARAGGTVVHHRAGHLGHLADPDAVVRVVTAAVTETGPVRSEWA